ncbi:MAG: aminotransferase class I/II-fold pyridoxal phosphate-dependent enzyme [Nanoarchaeota archaeon]|nr:aminotransferase class I/II-fold pyridoxal phosphate-dependent enzyme [Nanoarchaeota archaeon]
MAHISEREHDLPDAVIAKLLRIAVEDKSVVSLGPGEPDMNMPQPIIEEVKRCASKSNHYSPPGGRIELREAIVKKLKKDNNIDANPDNIIVTTGSQEALLLATACSLDVSEQVIIPDPSFLGYLPTFELFNAFPIALELKPEDNWNINPDAMKKLIDKKKTKAILINSPSNPTGNVLPKKILEEIADIAVDNNLYIFSDEAYEKLIYDKKHFSIGALNGMKNNVVTLQTFSKSYAMCGYRVGYAVGPSPLIEAMKKIHIYSTLCAPTISQMVAVKALSLNKSYIDKMVNEYDRRRKMIVKGLNQIGLDTVTPNGAFYTFSDISHLSDDSFKFSYDLLNNGKVAVVPGREFGRFGEGFIRCSYATDYKKIEEALRRIDRFVSKTS